MQRLLPHDHGELHQNTLFVEPTIFPPASPPGKRYTIAAVGDILLHEHLQRWAVNQGGFGFLWDPFITHLQQADITYGNLEIPLAAGIDREGREIADPGFHKETSGEIRMPGVPW